MASAPIRRELNIIRVRTSDVLRIPQLREVIKISVRLLRQVNIELSLRTISEIEPPILTYKEPFQYTGALRTYLINKHEVSEDPTVITHVFCPPIRIGRYAFFGGVGGCVCCGKPPFVSVSSAGVVTSLLRPKGGTLLNSCAIMMAHEIAHVFGASHLDTKSNIMDSSVNLYNSHQFTGWETKTKRDIADCQKLNGF